MLVEHGDGVALVQLSGGTGMPQCSSDATRKAAKIYWLAVVSGGWQPTILVSHGEGCGKADNGAATL